MWVGGKTKDTGIMKLEKGVVGTKGYKRPNDNDNDRHTGHEIYVPSE